MPKLWQRIAHRVIAVLWGVSFSITSTLISKATTKRKNAMSDVTKNLSDLERLTTEARSPESLDLDKLSAVEIVRLMNAEDTKVVAAVAAVSESIAEAIEVISERLANGGRLIYMGAGTSGRLGVLDAVECPPTFNTDPEMVQGLIAGGPEGLLRAVEGAEDSFEMGSGDLKALRLTQRDVVVGIAASGRTPYVIGGLDYARQLGAFTIGFSCNQEAEQASHVELNIIPVVGPEILSGSTRLKAGTATKMVLNMLTTGAMVRMCKTYSNLMVDVRASNEKLSERAMRIIATLTSCNHADSEALLKRCNGEVKTAIVVQKLGVSPQVANNLLLREKGDLRQVLENDPAT
jgi:N-acetylmuramic acid 6-phosphate etherase